MSRAAVHVEDLTYTYAGRSEPSLSGIAFSVERGSWNVIVGGTGSGKSTLLRALAGLIPRHSAGNLSGRVLLFDRDTREASPAALARTVGLVLQSPDDQICTTRVESEVAFGLESLATPVAEIDERITEALAAVGLEAFRHRATSELSGGQKQRLVLASILALRPQIVLLDEPFSQLDAASTRELLTELDRLRSRGVTIVIAEHRLLDVLPRADRVLLLDQGRLTFDGAPRSDDLSAAFAAADLEPPQISTDIAGALRGDHGYSFASPPARDAAANANSASNNGQPVVLQVRDLSYSYRSWSAETSTLRNISFDLRLGERMAVVGPNGSGKSTLFALLAGLLTPAAGSVEQTAMPGDRYPLGLVLQQADLMLFCRSVREELAFGPRQLRLSEPTVTNRVLCVARQLDLEPLLDEAPQALSQGQRLRVAVAATLTLTPRVLVLDEPTTGLDPRQLERLMQGVDPRGAAPGEEQHAVIFSTHDLRTVARYADRVLILDRGEIVVDAPTREVLKFK